VQDPTQNRPVLLGAKEVNPLKLVKGYLPELFIIAVGLVAGFIELFLVNDRNLGVIILSIGFLLSVAVLTLRKEIATQISQQLHILRTIEQIPNENWRREAENRLHRLAMELQDWAEGVRNLSREESVSYQIHLVNGARRKVQAIHVGIPLEQLFLWSRESGAFSRLRESYKQVQTHTTKQRLFICRRDEVVQGGRISNQEVLEVWKKQIQPVEQGGYGFEAKVRWVQRIEDIPPDLLLVDDKEAVVVKGGGMPHEHHQAVTSATLLDSYRSLFTSLWAIAEPIEEYLALDVA